MYKLPCTVEQMADECGDDVARIHKRFYRSATLCHAANLAETESNVRSRWTELPSGKKLLASKSF